MIWGAYAAASSPDYGSVIRAWDIPFIGTEGGVTARLGTLS
jgi:hypothetical protein